MSVIAWPVEPFAVSDMLRALEETVEEMQSTSMSVLTDAELRELMHGVERVGRKLGVVSHNVVTEVASRGSYSEWGYRRVTSMLTGELHPSPSEAHRRVRVAAATCPTTGITGEVTEPRHFDVAMGVYDGALSEQSADAVLTVLDKIPSAVDDDVRASAEATMVELARDLSPREVSGVGDRLLAHLDPDGTLTGDGDRARHRGLSLSQQDAALMSKLTATLDPATRAMLDVLLDAWAAPGMNNPDDPESPAGSRTDPDTDRDLAEAAAGRDTRSAPQRRHDALSAMLARVIATGTLGSHGGSPAQVVATMTLDELIAMSGVADTMTASQMPVEDLVDLAKENNALLGILDPTGMPLYLGRTGDWPRWPSGSPSGCDREAAPSRGAGWHRPERRPTTSTSGATAGPPTSRTSVPRASTTTRWPATRHTSGAPSWSPKGDTAAGSHGSRPPRSTPRDGRASTTPITPTSCSRRRGNASATTVPAPHGATRGSPEPLR
ncbi:hypothetical protein ASG12_20705 [Williamsia sp. Leaf354]|jgi:hypothetical protein|uniref:DUF222 domain-containing protein n=1 Tax=Williamsia sp. Leaf354 TaxID=1736349 RepID=UPI0006FAD470|nr:DUF222 domain-containing protein [Williamsia sp. Leaf354]KQR96546.1 hypothetical protein ASG12_20705 [Williamsia sp. Leaf354]